MNAPNPPHWTLNSYFHKFHCVWVHLLWFRNCMKLGAKRCELKQFMKKFVPRSHVWILRNERTQSASFWTLNSCFGALYSVWVHFGSFRNSIKLDAKQSELVQLMQKFVPRSYFRIFCNERTQSTPLDPKLMFRSILQYLGTFGMFCNCMKLVAKHTELDQLKQKFVPRSRVVIFRNQRT